MTGWDFVWLMFAIYIAFRLWMLEGLMMKVCEHLYEIRKALK